MVYCGKASQGCQSCRTRRIKCDKLKPDCSQCIRVGKKCPGYRDQLSLMFRDESSKVIQKAHAQWGVGEGPDTSSQASTSGSVANDPSSSKSPLSLSSHDHPSPTETLPSPPASHAGSSVTTNQIASEVSRLHSSVVPSLEEQGFQFYVNRYLIGHPDEPRNSEELKSYPWLFNPALRDVSAALGLAGLSNIRSDAELMTDARRRYGKALRTAGELIQSNNAPTIDLASRLVVMLAMFELVKGTQLGAGSVYAHVAGGAALIRSWFPMRMTPCGGVRPLLQLCYSTFLTVYEVGMPLPPMFHDWVSFSQRTILPEDKPAVKLGLVIARFVEIASFVRFSVPRGAKMSINSTLEQLFDIEEELGDWEDSLDGTWCYKTERASHLPPAAVFEGEYHSYYDMWVARIWNHYRWSRILVNQLILELGSNNAVSGQPLISAEGRRQRLATIRRFARDTLASTPSHWRHPLLEDKTPALVQQKGGAGAGAAGIPILLFHLRIAACAPGVPPGYLDWAYGVLECIWGDMGMHQAEAMMESLLAYRKSLGNPESGKPMASATKPKGYILGKRVSDTREQAHL